MEFVLNKLNPKVDVILVGALIVLGGILTLEISSDQQLELANSESNSLADSEEANSRNIETDSASDDLFTSDAQEQSDYRLGVSFRGFINSFDKDQLGVLAEEMLAPEHQLNGAMEYELFRRLAAQYPTDALNYFERLAKEKDQVIEAIFRELAPVNVLHAEKRSKTLSPEHQPVAIETILRYQQDLSLDEIPRKGQELGHTLLGRRIYDEYLLLEATLNQNPKEVLRKILSEQTPDEDRSFLIYELTSYWYTVEGIAAIPAIAELYEKHQFSEFHLADILAKCATSDPEESFHLALNFEEPFRTQTLRQIVITWGASKPFQAHAAIQQVSDGSLRNNLIRWFGYAWAKSSTDEFFNFLTMFENSTQEELRGYAVASLAQNFSDEVVELVLRSSVSPDVMRTVLSEWADGSPLEALDWLLKQETPLTFSQLNRILSKLVYQNPTKAFETAQRIATTNYGDQLEVSVLTTLAWLDPSLAMKLVSKARDVRRAYGVVGRVLVESLEFDAAIALGDELSNDDQENYYRSLYDHWPAEEKMSLFEILPSISHQSGRSIAAEVLLYQPDTRRYFNQEQRSILMSFVTETQPSTR